MDNPHRLPNWSFFVLRRSGHLHRTESRHTSPVVAGKREMTTMAIGTVKCFNAAKGYCFIKSDAGEEDALVHISAVGRAGLSALNEGKRSSTR